MRTVFLAAITLTVLAPVSLWGQSPKGWRGDGTGREPTARPVLEWSPSKNVVWKTELPGGSPANPVVLGDTILVTSDPALLLGIRAADGKILWQRGHTGKDLGAEGAAVSGDGGQFNPDGSAGSAAGTPVTDGKVVYAAFATGVVSAHALAGQRLWMRFIERPRTGYGHASSPVLIGGKLLIHLVDLVALDPATGKESWRLQIPATHSTCVGARIDDVPVIVHPSGAIIRAADGKVLADKLFKLDQSSPVVHNQVIYAHENGRVLAWKLPDRVSERLEMQKLWEMPAPRGQYQVASPVVQGGHLHGVSMNGIVHARDLQTGREAYRERLNVSGRVYVSVSLGGEHLFLADQTGKTIVFQPGSRYQVVRTNELDYHPSGLVFVGNRVLIRTWRHLYCLGN